MLRAHLTVLWRQVLTESVDLIASHADVLRVSSRVRHAGTRDEPLRTSAWEAIDVKVLSLK